MTWPEFRGDVRLGQLWRLLSLDASIASTRRWPMRGVDIDAIHYKRGLVADHLKRPDDGDSSDQGR